MENLQHLKENSPEEVWETLSGINIKYSVSNFGRVKSPTRILTPRPNQAGYLRVGISENGKIKDFYIHRLVAKYFILNKENKSTVNHIDGNKANNNKNNLEWVTQLENNLHSIKILKRPTSRGNNHWKSKLNQDKVDIIRKELESGVSTTNELALRYGVDSSIIRKVYNNKIWVKREL